MNTYVFLFLMIFLSACGADNSAPEYNTQPAAVQPGTISSATDENKAYVEINHLLSLFEVALNSGQSKSVQALYSQAYLHNGRKAETDIDELLGASNGIGVVYSLSGKAVAYNKQIDRATISVWYYTSAWGSGNVVDAGFLYLERAPDGAWLFLGNQK
jgi:hypothetical protein